MRPLENDGRLDRLRQALTAADLAAVVAGDPANFYYTSGHLLPGRTGASVTLTTVDGAQVLIVSRFEESVARWAGWIADLRVYSNWVEVHDLEELRRGTAQAVPKPVQFSREAIYGLLAAAIREQGLDRSRVGIEWSSLTTEHRAILTRLLPAVQWVDSQQLMYDVRSVKTPAEIERMRVATRLAEIGHRAVAAGPRGKTIEELRLAYRAAVIDEALRSDDARSLGEIRAYISAGERVGPNLRRDPHPIGDGDVIFIDSGTTVDGYASDIGRSYAVGDVDDLARRIHAALLGGYEAGLAALRPGTAMSAVFDVVNRVIQRDFPAYTRGHFGHVAGIGMGEQPPFFAPGETRLLEAGMVVNIETPYYVKGLGGFQIEDMLLITPDGYEAMSSAARAMVRV